MAGCGVVRGWVCGGCDFFIFSFILGRRRGACALFFYFAII